MTLGAFILLATTVLPASAESGKVSAKMQTPAESTKLVTIDDSVPTLTESVLIQAEPETQQTKGRRCRWVKGTGLVCNGGQFGTFNL